VPAASSADLTYGTYLRLDDLLSCQRPVTESPDELLFVIIHQVYELWFKQILHETELLQERLEDGDSAGAVGTAHRIAKILKTVVGQMDILETMTPRQFAAFRPELGSSSGFQSAQFRCLEAVLGRRDFTKTIVSDDPVLAGIVARRPLFASLLRYLQGAGWPVPATVLDRDPRQAWPGDRQIQDLLAGVYTQAGTAAEVCEALVDIDEGVQEWRYRHLKMVERVIGGENRHRRVGGFGVFAYHAVPFRVSRPVGGPFSAVARCPGLAWPGLAWPAGFAG